MGVITLALIANGTISSTSSTPTWVVVTCAAAISLGTYMGGWRISRTLGHGVTHLTSTQGFTSQITSSAVILSSSHFGLPLSTTYVATGSIVGSGLGAPPHRVRWRLLGRVGTAWVLTLPAAAVCGALAFGLESLFSETLGVIVVGLLLIAYCATVVGWTRRQAVTAANVNDPWEPTAVGSESIEEPEEVA
jgi:PiT family inorganic phosphate transporter